MCRKSFTLLQDVTNCVVANEMNVRRAVIRKKCQDSKAGHKLDPSKVRVMRQRKLLWCPVFKAGSTNWMLNLPKLSNFGPRELQLIRVKLTWQAMTRKKKLKVLLQQDQLTQPNEMLNFVAPEMTLEALEGYLEDREPVKFLIARHPIQRLISAYKDKFERYNKHYHEKYGVNIVAEYRKRGLAKFGEEHYKKLKANATQNFVSQGQVPSNRVSSCQYHDQHHILQICCQPFGNLFKLCWTKT